MVRMISLVEERPEDWWEIEALLDLCFAPGREMLSSYRLREGIAPVAELCLAARDGGGVLIGALRNWPVLAGGAEALLLGPVAVHPTHQGEGIGALLMHEAIARAAELGHERIMLVGDLPYYRRFGFARLADVEMPPPTNPERVLGLALQDGAWEGVTGRVEKAG